MNIAIKTVRRSPSVLGRFLHLLSPFMGLCLCAVSQPLHAQGAGPVPYLLDGRGTIVRSGGGLCWQTSSWSIEAAARTHVAGSDLPAGCICDRERMPAGTCETALAPPSAGPLSAAPAAPSAAPTIAQTKVALPAQTLFAFDRAEISSHGAEVLQGLAAEIRRMELQAVVAVGHTDRIGTESYHIRLSERRAQAVKDFLVAQGVAADRIRIEGRGEAEPVTDDSCAHMGRDSPRNRKLVVCLAHDRRVTIEAVGTRR